MDFYRFRRVENLIGEFAELKNQSIFFASPKILNDPMEGFSDIYWKGDRVLWNNIFRNYILHLENLFLNYLLHREKVNLEDYYSNFINVDERTYSPERSVIINNILKDFYNEDIENIITNILARKSKIKRDEIRFYFECLHFFIFSTIRKNYKDTLGFDENFLNFEKIDIIGIENLKKVFDDLREIEDIQKSDLPKILFETLEKNKAKNIFQFSLNDFEKKHKNLNFIFNCFSQEFLLKLENICDEDWYTACFMTECKNSSIWGTYGDNHSGVCLVYKSIEKKGKYYLPIEIQTSLSSSTNSDEPVKNFEYVDFELKKINYKKNFHSINFFKNIGRLTKPELNKFWYTDINNNVSNLSKIINNDYEKWHKRYWESLYNKVLIKTTDWKYENEYRIILQSFFYSYDTSQGVLAKYDFSSLKGMIFGIKTSQDDKLNIMKIIEDKSNEHKIYGFKFYQAYYCHREKCIKNYEIHTINEKDPS